MAKLDKKKTGEDDHLLEPVEAEDIQPEEAQEPETAAEAVPAQTSGKFARLKRVLRSKQFKIGAPAVLVALVAVCFFVEPVKFALLNVVSSGKASFVVVDDSTLAPVNDAKITVGGKTYKTDKNGKVTAKDLNFGNNTYSIEKETYTKKSATFKVKTGTNLVGPLKVHSNGVPVEVRATNKLSNEPVTDFAVAIDGTKISARSNKQGVAILKVPSDKLGKQTLSVSADKFNTSQQEVNIVQDKNKTAATLAISPAGNHYFLSNRDGKVGVYSADLDGANQSLVIEGSTADNEYTELSVAPDGKHAALTSKRDNIKDASGRPLSALYSIDLEAKTIKRIDEGAPIFTILGWMDNSKIAYFVSYDDWRKADNSKIKTADITNAKLATIVSASDISYSFFNEDPSRVYVFFTDNTKPDYGLFSYNLTTKAKQRLHSVPGNIYVHKKPYSFIFRDWEDAWHEVNMKTQKVQPTGRSDDRTTVYVSSDNRESLAWVETRDGKGTVITGNGTGDNSNAITKNMNASIVRGWVDNRYVIFNASNNNENADYIVDVKTGTTTKISDVFRNKTYYYNNY